MHEDIKNLADYVTDVHRLSQATVIEQRHRMEAEIRRLEKEVQEAVMFGVVGLGVGVIALCAAITAVVVW